MRRDISYAAIFFTPICRLLDHATISITPFFASAPDIDYAILANLSLLFSEFHFALH
jgi:hypothetical protein